MRNPREILVELTNGMNDMGKYSPNGIQSFMNFVGAVSGEGKIDVKTKELISVGIAAFSRCEYCIVFHTYNAFKAGATAEEILEAGMVAAGFGGGPSIGYISTLLKASVEEFQKDFVK